jgi:hypothetical protein
MLDKGTGSPWWRGLLLEAPLDGPKQAFYLFWRQHAATVVKPALHASTVVKPALHAATVVKPALQAATVVKPALHAATVVKPALHAVSLRTY